MGSRAEFPMASQQGDSSSETLSPRDPVDDIVDLHLCPLLEMEWSRGYLYMARHIPQCMYITLQDCAEIWGEMRGKRNATGAAIVVWFRARRSLTCPALLHLYISTYLGIVYSYSSAFCEQDGGVSSAVMRVGISRFCMPEDIDRYILTNTRPN
jgi:hypothetical protein